MSDIELVVGYATLKKANEELAKTGRVAKTTVASFNQAFSKAVSWQQKFQAEQGRVNASLNRHYLESQKSNKSAKESAAAFMKEAKELERLNNKFVAGHRATSLYNKELDDLALAHSKGVISAEQQAMAIEGLNRDMAAGIGIFSGLGKQAGNTRNKMNSTGMAFQQVGYQVGDFAVQVQSGQSAFVAFSQQATQLVGILPSVASQLGLTMKMAIGLSAGLGIAIPVVTSIGGILWRMKDSSEGAADGVKSFEERLKSAREVVRSTSEDLRLLNSGFASTAELTLDDAVKRATKKLLEAQARLEGERTGGHAGRINRERVARQQELVNLAQEELELAIAQREQLEKTKRLREDARAAQESFMGLLREQNLTQQENFRAAREEIAAQEEANELRAVEIQYGKDSLEYLNAQHEIQKTLLEQRIEEEKLTENLANGLREALGVAQAFETVDMGIAIRRATTDTNNFIAKLGRAVSIASALDTVKTNGLSYGGRGAGGAGMTEEERFLMSQGGINVSDEKRIADAIDLRLNPKKVKTGGSRSSKTDNQKTLKELEELAIKTRELANAVGLEGEQLRMVADIRKQLGDTEKNYSDAAIRAAADRIVAYEMAQEALEKAQAAQEDLANDMASAMGDAFSDWRTGVKSFKDAFRDMADDIIKQLFEILVVQRLVGNFDASTGRGSGLAGFIGPLLGGLFADGAAFNKGSVVPFATGGVVSSATMFPMAGGKSGVMGEAGPEAIMPLTRGADGKLGVKASGGGSGGNTTITFYVDAKGAQVGVAEQIDAKLRVLAPKIVAQSVKSTKRSMTKTKAGWA